MIPKKKKKRETLVHQWWMSSCWHKGCDGKANQRNCIWYLVYLHHSPGTTTTKKRYQPSKWLIDNRLKSSKFLSSSRNWWYWKMLFTVAEKIVFGLVHQHKSHLMERELKLKPFQLQIKMFYINAGKLFIRKPYSVWLHLILQSNLKRKEI